jgi:multicomponent Na+:H+ antiporter subunit E
MTDPAAPEAAPDARGASAPETRSEARWRMRQQLPVIALLVVLWMMLWGAVSVLNLVTGTVLAVLVTRVFYLPTVALTGRFDPWRALVFLGVFVVDLTRGSLQVAFLAVRGVRSNSVVAVQLDSRSDLMTTLTAVAVSLVPGSIVVEVDRDRSILYLHVLATPDRDAAAAAGRTVLAVERRIVRACGSAADLRRVTA